MAERIVPNLGLTSYFCVLSQYYGTLAVAAYTVGVSSLSFSWIPGTGYAQACSTVVGQALGAGRSEGALHGAQRSLDLAISTAIPLGLLCAWLRVPVALLLGALIEVRVEWLWATLIFDHIARTALLGASFARGRWRQV